MKSKSRTTTDLLPISPGEILLEEFLHPTAMSINALATKLHVPANRIQEIVRGRRGITADTALRLGHYFGTTPEFWMNLQTDYDLRIEKRAKLAEVESLPTLVAH